MSKLRTLFPDTDFTNPDMDFTNNDLMIHKLEKALLICEILQSSSFKDSIKTEEPISKTEHPGILPVTMTRIENAEMPKFMLSGVNRNNMNGDEARYLKIS